MHHRHTHITAWAFAGISAIGFLDALYLSIERFRGVPVICTIIEGCDKVNASVYSTVFGVPVAYLGLVYYFSIFLLAVWFFATRDHRSVALAATMTVVGLLASLWFVYVQLAILHTICLYCMISATTSSLLFIMGVYYLMHTRRAAFGEPRIERAQDGTV